MQISIGRIVHFQSLGSAGGEHPSAPQAAICTKVHPDGRPDLTVFTSSGDHKKFSVDYSETPKPGCWNWPPRT